MSVENQWYFDKNNKEELNASLNCNNLEESDSNREILLDKILIWEKDEFNEPLGEKRTLTSEYVDDIIQDNLDEFNKKID